MTTPFSAGALYSTVEDLLRWERALFGQKVLSEASLKKMTTPGKNDYAFGLYVGEVAGRLVIRHGGGIAGFNSHLRYFPEDAMTVVALSNLNGFGTEDRDQLSAAAQARPWCCHPNASRCPSPRSILEKYVGTYQLGPDFNIWFTIEGDQLMSQATGQPKFAGNAESETIFSPTAFEAQLEFQTDASGNRERHHSTGRT